MKTGREQARKPVPFPLLFQDNINSKNNTAMMTDKMPGNVSVICGSLLSATVSFSSGDITRTLILGALGTVVSYWVSRALKAIFE
jgi:hypothetical protein